MSVASIAFMAPHGRFRNLFVTDGGTIISDNGTFDTDGLGNVTATSVTTNIVTANVDNVQCGTLQPNEVTGGAQTLVSGNIMSLPNTTTTIRTTSAANVTAIQMPFPTQPSDGQLLIILNVGGFSQTFDIAANSGMADGVSAVISTNRAFVCIWDPTESGGQYYHT